MARSLLSLSLTLLVLAVSCTSNPRTELREKYAPGWFLMDGGKDLTLEVAEEVAKYAISSFHTAYPEHSFKDILHAIRTKKPKIYVTDEPVECNDSPNGLCAGLFRVPNTIIVYERSEKQYCAATTSLAHELTHWMQWTMRRTIDYDHSEEVLWGTDTSPGMVDVANYMYCEDHCPWLCK